ncbi:hypothetical protein DVH24_023699 [Malus domestica]|uniref:Uncharacterized protein n=1 Tax=Malus domestica TaxID=3750 RepID=A0A498I5R1_MALDO|nr:hypothetical protein DVH24_023699 [Malus domestica]
MGVAEMRMLPWMCGHTRKDKIRNEVIQGKVGVAEIERKMRKLVTVLEKLWRRQFELTMLEFKEKISQ